MNHARDLRGAIAVMAGAWINDFRPDAPAADAQASPGAIPPAGALGVGEADDWSAFGRTLTGTRYSPDTQITPANARRLELAWTFRTGELERLPARLHHTFEATPLKIGDAIYLCTPLGNIIALDSDTGKLRWRHDVKPVLGDTATLTCRGVGYHESPTVVGDVAVVGAYVRDSENVGEPSGVVRAYDVHDGRLRSAWDAGRAEDAAPPRPGESYTRGSVNAWSLFSVDAALGLIYIPTGNATPDQVGMHRTPQDERNSSSVVALDVATGKVRWRFQTTHHDLCDYDVPAQPVVFEMPIGRATVPALAVATKRGEIFILDRRDGRSLTPVVERPVPQGSVPGERYAATQPYAVGFPSLAPPALTERDMWGATALDQVWCRIRFRSLDYRGDLTPRSLRGTFQYPGLFGAINLGSVTIDEQREQLIVNSSRLPVVVRLMPRADVGAALKSAGADVRAGYRPQNGMPYASFVLPMRSPLGVPCNAPPWGHLSAIDLRTRKLAWQRLLGTSRDIAPLGISVRGIFNLGGSTVTRGGAIFIAATMDGYLRAFDARSGRELGKGRLPAGGQASPITYSSARSGRQYVAAAAGGHAFLGTKLGDYVVAFALPATSGGARGPIR